MAMKKTVTRYGRRSNRYFRARVEGVFTISFPAQFGAPIFVENNHSNTVTFNTLFSASQYYGSLTSMFGYYKVTGVLMEVVPGQNNFKGLNEVGMNVLLGFNFGKDTAMTYQQLVADNNSLILGLDTIKRKYTSTMGSTGWVSTADNTPLGSFSVGSPFTSEYTGAPSWTCRLVVYMLFKKSNF